MVLIGPKSWKRFKFAGNIDYFGTKFSWVSFWVTSLLQSLLPWDDKHNVYVNGEGFSKKSTLENVWFKFEVLHPCF